jgi:hypothetical protein
LKKRPEKGGIFKKEQKESVTSRGEEEGKKFSLFSARRLQYLIKAKEKDGKSHTSSDGIPRDKNNPYDDKDQSKQSLEFELDMDGKIEQNERG